MRRIFLVCFLGAVACTPFPAAPAIDAPTDASTADAGFDAALGDGALVDAPAPACEATTRPWVDGTCPKPVEGGPVLRIKSDAVPNDAQLFVTSGYAYVLTLGTSFRFPRRFLTEDGAVLPDCAIEKLPDVSPTAENIALLNRSVCVLRTGGAIDCFLDGSPANAPLRVAPNFGTGVSPRGIAGVGDTLAIAVGQTSAKEVWTGIPGGEFQQAPRPAGSQPWTGTNNYWRYFGGGLVAIGAEGGSSATLRSFDASGWAADVPTAPSVLTDNYTEILPAGIGLIAAKNGWLYSMPVSDSSQRGEMPDIVATAFARFRDPLIAVRQRRPAGTNYPAVDSLFRIKFVATSESAPEKPLNAGNVAIRWAIGGDLGVLGRLACTDDTYRFATLVTF